MALPNAELLALFPCKPEVHERPAVGSAGVAMGLAQCEVEGHRFSVAWADTADVQRVGLALGAMAASLASKLGAELPAGDSFSVKGMTPHAESLQFRIVGTEGRAMTAVFAYGPRVYQAVLLGGPDEATAWDGFAAGLRIRPGSLPSSHR